MRTYTQHMQHTYTTKASALRAARNDVGSSFLVNTPEVGGRFDEIVTVTEDMIGVYPHGKGWRWAFCYSLADVVVRVMGENGEPTDVPFVDVCHWPNPMACIADPLRGIGAMLADYYDTIKRAPSSGVAEKIQERRMPGLLFACEIHDTTLSKVQDIFNAVSNISRRYADGQRHEDRLYIWDLLCVAEVYGLDTLELRSLYEHLLAASKQPSAA